MLISGTSAELVEDLRSPAFVLDSRGQILSANSGGLSLLSIREEFRRWNGRLVISTSSPSLTEALARLADGSSSPIFLSIGPVGGRTLPATLIPLFSSGSVGAIEERLLLVGVSQRGAPPSWVLQQQFGLTDTEARFLQEFASAPSIAKASAALGIREATGRRHIKAAFEKTATHSQAELVHLLLSHPATDEMHPFLRASPAPGRRAGTARAGARKSLAK